MKKDIAVTINDLMIEYGAKLDESVRLVMQSCSEEEFQSYRAAIAQIMGTMLIDVMQPIYREHPELKPPELEE
jgi:hypothetical protein